MEEHTKHYLISGRVQGVGFRRFTERVAQTLSLRGWVRNLHDGRVEAMARGPLEALKIFEEQIKIGPPHGHVVSVVVAFVKAVANFDSFSMRKDGAEPWSEK